MDLVRIPLSEEEIKDRLDRTEKGQVRQSIHNCLEVFRYDPILQGSICYNILTGRKDIVKPVPWEKTVSQLTDTDIKYFLLYLEEHYDLVNEKKILSAMEIIANENRYHPIRDYLNSLKWDGKKRISEVLHYFLGADMSEYTHEAMKLFLMGAIHRVFHAGCKFETMLCLVGGQGAGKSTFFRFLAVIDEWFSDDLRRLEDDNVYRKLQGHWIIEMSEMIATASAKSIEEIKAFLSRQKETYKVPYATQPEDRPRQCVFAGTSNSLDFLPLDRTGNRRFIPVMIHPEQAECHILDDEKKSREYMNQLWAEAMELYRTGNYQLRFSNEMQKQVEEIQKSFMPEDTKAGIIQSFLDDYKEDYVCSILLYREALNHTYDEPKSWETKEICSIMNHSIDGWEEAPVHRFKGYGRQRSWKRVNKTASTENGFVPIPKQMEIPFDGNV